jgi:hypothetical protein
MNSSDSQNNKAKHVLFNILAGIIFAIIGFGLGGGLAFMISTYLICEWSCEMGIIQAGIISVPIGIITGVVVGTRKYKRLSKDEEVSGDDSSGNALEKFIQKINSLKLEESAEEYLKHGMVLSEKFEFDDAILEFVKVISVSTPEDNTYQTAKKQLKGMGFSESDIKHISQ